MSERPAAPEATRAFTLLELLLAMTALALVTAICYGAFHLGIRAVERGEVAVVTAQRLRVASDTLIRQIKSIVAYPARNPDDDPEADEIYRYFVGSATSMTFVTAAGLQGGGGLRRVVYQVVEEPARLVVEESAFFSADTLGAEPVTQADAGARVLLDGFRSLTFEYLNGEESEWVSEWVGREQEVLPVAVRVVVEGMAGMETDTWGQEIPVMVAHYGENGGDSVFGASTTKGRSTTFFSGGGFSGGTFGSGGFGAGTFGSGGFSGGGLGPGGLSSGGLSGQGGDDGGINGDDDVGDDDFDDIEDDE